MLQKPTGNPPVEEKEVVEGEEGANAEEQPAEDS